MHGRARRELRTPPAGRGARGRRRGREDHPGRTTAAALRAPTRGWTTTKDPSRRCTSRCAKAPPTRARSRRCQRGDNEVAERWSACSPLVPPRARPERWWPAAGAAASQWDEYEPMTSTGRGSVRRREAQRHEEGHRRGGVNGRLCVEPGRQARRHTARASAGTPPPDRAPAPASPRRPTRTATESGQVDGRPGTTSFDKASAPCQRAPA